MTFDDITKPLLAILGFIAFIIASALFLPALLIVTLLQDYWSKSLGDLFGI